MANTNIFLFLPPLPSDKTNSFRQSHSYGPDDGGGFNTDLGIEILANRTPVPFSAALAACNGRVRCIPEQNGPVATLVLKPDWKEKRDIHSTLGMSGSTVIVYRNIDKSSIATWMTTFFQTPTGHPPLTDKTPQQLGQLFAQGNFWAKVTGGTPMGEASTDGAASGWARIGFEIVFMPGGITTLAKNAAPETSEAWNRLQALIRPTALTRRLDPVTFYSIIAQNTGAARIDASHANHILLTLPTRRTLIEVRDEYDRPYTGPVTISNGTGSPVTSPAPDGSRGTFVKDTVPPGGAPGTFSYEVSIPRHIFTDLPSASESAEAPSKLLMSPAHWSTQTMYMWEEPVNQDEEDKSWFVANTDSLKRFTRKNKVTIIRDGVATFRAYKEAIDTITGPGHFLELAGWTLFDDFSLVHGVANSTFNQLCHRVVNAGAEVRAMLWDDSPKQDQHNTAPWQRINELPNGLGRAILDNETSLLGSHHQKMLVVNGSNGAVGFCGGVDINPDRLDSPRHGAIGGFHDVHAKFEGPAVNDLHRNFFRRWNFHPRSTQPLSTDPLPVATNPGTIFVEISRTFSPAYTQSGLGHYPFVSPNGSLTPYEVLRRALRRAQKYVYIEDQYLTPYPGTNPVTAADDTFGLLTEFRSALTRIDHLVIVIPNHSDQDQSRFRRQQFISSLKSAEPNKVHVFFLGRNGQPHPRPEEEGTDGGGPGHSGGDGHRDELYCHSKVWMVDDVVAKLGSSNLNRRSYSNDTELDAVLCDEAVDNGGRRFIKQFRKELWGEHLGLSGAQRELLDDVDYAMTFFSNPPKGARIRAYDHNAEIEPDHNQAWWDDAVDPDGRLTD